MKTSLNHLPKQKQDELEQIVSTIRKNCSDVEKIILLGSYARGDCKEEKDLRTDRKSGHVSDYDILVVTSKAITALDSMLWKKISDECRALKLSADPRIITHDINELNSKLSVGQYFYTDVKKEGIAIFDSGKSELAEKRKLNDEERKKLAKEHFEHWFGRARGFFSGYEFNLSQAKEGDANLFLALSAFNLHQAAENSLKAALLVLTNYNPNDHFIANLKKECEQYIADLRELFLQETKADEERFELFEYAYIGARYDMRYRISKEDLEILEKDVRKLLEITQRVCEQRIS